jgi:hypothetical protein
METNILKACPPTRLVPSTYDFLATYLQVCHVIAICRVYVCIDGDHATVV